ncbi:MAG TPA: LAGLIDADG family homing endonuclease, partial [Candidatus Thermoplasmatota archaeon]|nr:LAGLIDADG family homing endonuclease [Candidatus Thermoplasmatota archaeon]
WERFLKDYYRAQISEAALAWPRIRGVEIDWWALDKHDPDLAQLLLQNPTQTLVAAEAALRTVELPLPDDGSPPREAVVRLEVRPTKLPDHAAVDVRDLRAEHLGRLVAVRGLVKKATEVRPRIHDAVFRCARCGAHIREPQEEHLVLREPLECYEDQGGCGRTSNFRLVTEAGPRAVPGSTVSMFVDTQKLEIQEFPEDLRGGDQPQRLSCFAESDQCGAVSPGDRITFNGVLRSSVRKTAGVKSTLLDIHLDILAIEMDEQEYDEVVISPEEEEEIRRFSLDPELFDKMRASIAPDLYGLDVEKESLLLQLFGGLAKTLPSGLRLRGDIHILLVGDPGVAKSQLLRYTSKLAPRGIYTSGKSSSAAGLTAAAVKDEFGEGRWTLEAGALVLADKGIACIDEMDKMEKTDQSSMHEAMEQQSYHPDFELLIADGRRVRIGELVDGLMSARSGEVVQGVECEILPVRGLAVPSIDLETHAPNTVTVARVSRHVAPASFVRIVYSNGRSVVVTPEHPVFVGLDGGISTTEARHIRPGAWVPAPRTLPAIGHRAVLRDEPPRDRREKAVTLPASLDADLAEFLGLIVAEGHTYEGSSHEIGFSNTDPVLLDRARALAFDLFDVGSSDSVNAEGTTTLRWISTRLLRWFRANFPEVTRKAREKRAPAAVLAAPEGDVARFLRGAFCGDGSVGPDAVALCTASHGLASDYADLLLRLGIASRSTRDGAADAWKVYITGDGLARFSELVVAESDPRRRKVTALVERGAAVRRGHDVLPTDAAEELACLQDLLGTPRDGKYAPHAEKDHGVQVATVREELTRLRARAGRVLMVSTSAAGLRGVREAVGWSQAALAAELGVPRGTLAYAEAGGYDAETRGT